MVISNSSNTWDWWKAPPVTPLLMVYIFNYTNADSFGRDGSKLRVQEVGPFTYEYVQQPRHYIASNAWCSPWSSLFIVDFFPLQGDDGEGGPTVLR